MKNKINHTKENEIKGLTEEEVAEQRRLHGSNKRSRDKNVILSNLLSVIKQPMFLLLLAACGVYFSLREFPEAITMLIALVIVAGIDVFQNFKSQKAIQALRRYTEAKAKVIRDSKVVEINAEDIVMQDVILCDEGTIIPADAEIISSNDFSVNEAILTGESMSVEKFSGDDIVQGTNVVRGYCFAKVHAIGQQTTLSKFGELVSSIEKEKTPLQLKVARFVKIMVIAGGIAFAFVWIYNWWESGSVFHGLLHGLTMAMSVLPEEIPVALSSFMALGAYRLLKRGVIARSGNTVEALGAATVICLDKTGTLTQNLMNLAHTYSADTLEEVDFNKNPKATELLEYAMWASEETPFDPMEKSIHKHYEALFKLDKRKEYHMVKEFPLSGKYPVMVHVFQNDKKEYIISSKGALEGIINLCQLSEEQKSDTLKKAEQYAKDGLRVLGVAKGHWNKQNLPELMEDIKFDFLGILTFSDPPVANIKRVVNDFYEAGVDVKMITGDFKETAIAIAKQTGIKTNKSLTGDEIDALTDKELDEIVASVHIFARVTPETKLHIINSLKRVGKIVSMTGDGVNDAPALKAAHIGIAMGVRGTEVAKGAAGLVLANDDLSKMVDAIFLGRRINENLSKAIRYIISIHVPIILLVTMPIFFGWLPVMLLSPIHVIFLELIMGPTCSIIYENEEVPEEDLRNPTETGSKNLFKTSQLWLTIIQGLMITAGCLFIGYYASSSGYDDSKIRSYIFSTLIFSNVFLTLVNRSFKKTIFNTLRRRNKYIPLIVSISVILLLLILNLPFLSELFEVIPLTPFDYMITIGVSLIATLWLEPVKYYRSKADSDKS